MWHQCRLCGSFFLYGYGDHRDLDVLTHSGPTRGSSDRYWSAAPIPSSSDRWRSTATVSGSRPTPSRLLYSIGAFRPPPRPSRTRASTARTERPSLTIRRAITSAPEIGRAHV